MAQSCKKLLVVDVESTCWDGDTPIGQQNEIIEIGICFIDLSILEPEPGMSIFVKPKYSKISDFCTSLTSIEQKDVDQGISFTEACSQLRKMNIRHITWGSWGDYDRRQFERQCNNIKFSYVSYPFGPTHLNIKNLFALQMGLNKEVGMDKALDMLNIKLKGTHHRGIDDAQNIARILCHLLKHSRENSLV